MAGSVVTPGVTEGVVSVNKITTEMFALSANNFLGFKNKASTGTSPALIVKATGPLNGTCPVNGFNA